MKHICAIQVDLDSYATLLRFYNYHINESDIQNSSLFYLKAIPRFLNLFARYGIKATFFISGWDIDSNIEVLDLIRLIYNEGHEIANHSYNHNFNLTNLDREVMEEDIEKNSLFIENITGCRPVGFKCPGYSMNRELLCLLADKGYLYDSSVMPSFYYYFYKKIRNMFVSNDFKSGNSDLISIFSPTRPYLVSHSIWNIALSSDIIEIPADCIPILKFPFYSNTLFWFYKKPIIKFFYSLLKKKHMCFTMHGIDLVDFKNDNVDARLRNHLAVTIDINKKIEIIESFFDMVEKDFLFKRSDKLASNILKNKL